MAPGPAAASKWLASLAAPPPASDSARQTAMPMKRFIVLLLVAALAVLVVLVPMGTSAQKRPIVLTGTYATYSVMPDGSNWRQLNQCTLSPLSTDGRQLVGWIGHNGIRSSSTFFPPVRSSSATATSPAIPSGGRLGYRFAEVRHRRSSPCLRGHPTGASS